VAAVNYHFGDKVGLYTEILLERARFAEEARRAASVESKPEEQLRGFIRAYLSGVLSSGKPDTLMNLIATEMQRPSPALRKIVRQIIRPTEARLRAVVGQIVGLPSDDDAVRMCAHSIVGQCLHYKHAAAVLNVLWPDLWRMPDRIDRLAEHIAGFSLAGLKARRKHATRS
jgi:AcrR family transcriptional regulator